MFHPKERLLFMNGSLEPLDEDEKGSTMTKLTGSSLLRTCLLALALLPAAAPASAQPKRQLDTLCREGYQDKYNKCGHDPYPSGGPGSPMDPGFRDLCEKQFKQKDLNLCREQQGLPWVEDEVWLWFHGYSKKRPR